MVPIQSVIIDAQQTTLVTVPPPGNYATMITFAPVPMAFELYRNGLFQFIDDSTGVDYSYDATKCIIYLALGLEVGEEIQIDLYLPGGSMNISSGEVPVGAINVAQSATVSSGSSATSFESATQFAVGSVFLFTSGTAGNIGKSCIVTGVTGSGPWTYAVSNASNTTGLVDTPTSGDGFVLGYSFQHAPATNVRLYVSGGRTLVQTIDYELGGTNGNILTTVTFAFETGDVYAGTYWYT
jgi:hypothetical protein